jgi:hypothetical protein
LVLTAFFDRLDEHIAPLFEDFFAGLDESTGLSLSEFVAGLGESIGALLGPAVGWMWAGRERAVGGLMPSEVKSPWRVNAKIWEGLPWLRSARTDEVEVVSIDDTSLSELE